MKKTLIITRRLRLFGSSAPAPSALLAGTRARSAPVFTVLATIVLFADGLLLGYIGTTVRAHAAPRLDVPTPAINIAPPVPRNWGVQFLGHSMSDQQQYTCDKFGPACSTALAIQAAENLKGDCEAYHYNSNGTLDWGYFQINSVHLTRRSLNLRDLLDCKANIDFAYQLYTEEGFQPWSTFVSGQYRKFLDPSLAEDIADRRLRRGPQPLLMPAGFLSR